MKKKKIKLRKGRIILAFVFLVGLIVLIFTIIKIFQTYHATSEFQVSKLTNSRNIDFSKQPSTILFLGVDGLDKKDAANEFEKKERSGAQRADSMILMDFNPSTGQANMTSVMRDIKMPISCDNNIEDKVGHAFSSAYEQKNSISKNIENGAKCVAKTLENKFEIPIDNYIYINFSGFIRAIEKIGGITIPIIGNAEKGTKFCEQDEHGNGGNPDENTWWIGKYCFKVGETRHLNAKQALAYSRHRHMDSDLWRNKRQQQVMKSIIKELIKPRNIWNLPNILNSLSTSIKSTINISELLNFTKEHSEYLSNLDNSLIIHSNVIKFEDDMQDGIYYAKYDEEDFIKTTKKIKNNLEIEKELENIPKKIKPFDFDYYLSKSE